MNTKKTLRASYFYEISFLNVSRNRRTCRWASLVGERSEKFTVRMKRYTDNGKQSFKNQD